MSSNPEPNASATSSLAQLRRLSTIVADTGEIDQIKRLQPTDATTNPSLVLAAAQQPDYAHLVEAALDYAAGGSGSREQRADRAVDRLMLLFGREITQVIPRHVSTEVDAHLSFDTAATIDKGRALIAGYDELGVGRERILVKIAATWAGIRAASVLEAEGIRCNMTLIFSLAQAAACFDAGVTLISPFVGRITDWYKQHEGVGHYPAESDPGVASVRRIHAYARAHAFPTWVMGASFRNVDQALALAGADLLTLSPALLDELDASQAAVTRAIDTGAGEGVAQPRMGLRHADFELALVQDAMASEKLAEGIRRFAADQNRLRQLLGERLK